MAEHGQVGNLVISVQVLLETHNVLTRKRRADPAVALAAVRLFSRHEVAAASGASALLALELAAQHGLSPWDALIVQAALDAGCDTLFSEDLQAGRRFGGLQLVNPFVGAAHASTPGSAGGVAPMPARKVTRKAGPRAVRGTA